MTLPILTDLTSLYCVNSENLYLILMHLNKKHTPYLLHSDCNIIIPKSLHVFSIDVFYSKCLTQYTFPVGLNSGGGGGGGGAGGAALGGGGGGGGGGAVRWWLLKSNR
jgi:uncharacterized membrane protein YgcG